MILWSDTQDMVQLSLAEKIHKILNSYRVIAVVGLSPKPARPSHRVALYMLKSGYRVIPVNPGHDEILGQTCYPDLMSVPEQVEIVNIFRRSDRVLSVVKDAIEKQARVIWMQEGIVNDEAAELAHSNGLEVIMDRCLMVDHQHFGSTGAK